jgi:septal ring factor EnvC (AmiA/AmiB activator)
MKQVILSILLAGIVVGAVGCASKPSAEELKQLEDLRAEVSSLEREISSKESEKAAVRKAIADKDAALKKCADDKAATQQRLRGM